LPENLSKKLLKNSKLNLLDMLPKSQDSSIDLQIRLVKLSQNLKKRIEAENQKLEQEEKER